MKLNLDFSLYKGTTRLKQWWKEVLSHFTQVQEAHNALDTALSDEITDRTNGDSNLQTQLNTHTASRGSSAVYGHVKLSDSVATSSSTATAATPAAVKTAYDKAAQGVNDAAAFPFSSFEVYDPEGIFLGLNKYNNSVAILDFFDADKYSNANACILGMSGTGKTFLMQLMALRLRQQGIQVFILVKVTSSPRYATG